MAPKAAPLVVLVLVLGVRDGTFLVAFYLLTAVCGVLAVWIARAKHPKTQLVVALMVLSNVLYVAAWPVFGITIHWWRLPSPSRGRT